MKTKTKPAKLTPSEVKALQHAALFIDNFVDTEEEESTFRPLLKKLRTYAKKMRAIAERFG